MSKAIVSSTTILMADDDEDDIMMTRDAFVQAGLTNDFRAVHDGEELLEYLRRTGRYANPDTSPSPGIILLDLNMPRMDGREALREIRSEPLLRSIPVIILTTSKAEEDILRSYDLGANSFIVKPISFEQFVEKVTSIGQYWLHLVSLPKQDN